MEIAIKKIGYNVGTVGWLAKGLTDGTIVIYEALTLSEKLALWFKTKTGETEHKFAIAIYNPYSNYDWEVEGAEQFAPKTFGGSPDDPAACKYGALPLTDACKCTIYEIATQWCAARNAERYNDVERQPIVTFGS